MNRSLIVGPIMAVRSTTARFKVLQSFADLAGPRMAIIVTADSGMMPCANRRSVRNRYTINNNLNKNKPESLLRRARVFFCSAVSAGSAEADDPGNSSFRELTLNNIS
jgi:hypothetical protein